jgi:hypothetical protein
MKTKTMMTAMTMRRRMMSEKRPIDLKRQCSSTTNLPVESLDDWL